MQKVQEIAKALNVVPKLRFGIKLAAGGVQSTGPHEVIFVQEPTVVMGKDDKGNPRKEMKFILEENGTQYRWNVPIMSKEGQPSYLIEKLMDIEVGAKRIVELMKSRGANYYDIRTVEEAPEPPDESEEASS